MNQLSCSSLNIFISTSLQKGYPSLLNVFSIIPAPSTCKCPYLVCTYPNDHKMARNGMSLIINNLDRWLARFTEHEWIKKSSHKSAISHVHCRTILMTATFRSRTEAYMECKVEFSNQNQLITEANVSTTKPFWRDLFNSFKCLAGRGGWCSANDTEHDFFFDLDSDRDWASDFVSIHCRCSEWKEVLTKRLVLAHRFFWIRIGVSEPNRAKGQWRCEKAFISNANNRSWVGIEINFMYHH